MANRSVSLIYISKTPDGWRRYPAAIGGNGRVRPHYAMVDGNPVHYPEGRYELRTYVGSKPRYTPIGD